MYTHCKATTEDCFLIRSLAERIWSHTYGRILSPQQLAYMFEMMYAPENILRQMTKEGHTYFIVRDDEKNPVGYFSIQRHDANTYLFQKIYALPEQHGKGVGRYMIEQGIAEVAALHCASFSMMLYVNRENPAVGFYRHMGFQVIDTRDYPIGNEYYMNDYIMKRDIFRE